jgi:predicted dehydrogenase
MKIGIIGLGSIGQRHARTLFKLGITDIYALRSKKGTITKLPTDLQTIKEVYSQDEFYDVGLDGVIIANPTSLHIETMKKALENDIAVFVEKPLANHLSEVKELETYDLSKVLVGFTLRYDAIMNIIKDFLDSKKLGEIYKAYLYCGQYLPHWHPYADYKKEYYSRKELGGGVIRTLCHEIDIMHYLFGVPQELIGIVEKISSLQIDVDDNAFLICRMKNNALITIELDYLNPKDIRNGVVFGSRGILEYTYSSPEIKFIDNNGQTNLLYKKEKQDWDTTYKEEMEDFISCISSGSKPKSTFHDGVEVMNIIEKAELSTKSKSWQKIK